MHCMQRKELKNTSNTDRYIRTSWFWRYLFRPLLQRLTWLLAFALSITSIVSLTVKIALNLIDSLSTPSSLKTVRKNALGLLFISIGGSIVSALSIILPEFVGNPLVRAVVFAAPAMFKQNSKVPIGKRSIAEEVGPKETPEDTKAFQLLHSVLHPISLPPTRTFPLVKGIDGIIIDTVDIPFPGTSNYRLCFNATSSYYQKHIDRIVKQQPTLKVNTRLFNYPGVTKKNAVDSLIQLVNAGIAEVYDLAERHNWSNAEVEQNIHLYAYCSGVPIALKVAAYFKQHYHIKLKVFADRGYIAMEDVAAENAYRVFGLPLFQARALTASMLYASGEFHISAAALLNELDHDQVYAINVFSEGKVSPFSWGNTIRNQLGIGESAVGSFSTRGDSFVPNQTALITAIVARESTKNIFNRLKIKTTQPVVPIHFDTEAHVISLDELRITPPEANAISNESETALDYYARVINS